MFQFTFTRGKIDNSVNAKGGPYVFKVDGQNHHRIGPLLPNVGQNPKFAQLYIYDIKMNVQTRWPLSIAE